MLLIVSKRNLRVVLMSIYTYLSIIYIHFIVCVCTYVGMVLL